MALDEHVLERRLTKLRLAGPELSHSRKNNLEAVKRLTGRESELLEALSARHRV